MRHLAVLMTLLALVSRLHAQELAPIETYSPDQRDHWSYQPLSRPEPPDVREAHWVRNPIDRFVLFGIEDIGFQHAAEASRIELIRRLTYDLTGLPPSPEQVRAFLNDSAPTPTSSSSTGCSHLPPTASDGRSTGSTSLITPIPTASNSTPTAPTPGGIRDWVVEALNSDMPYDQFVQLQLAGDELKPGDPSAAHRHRLRPLRPPRGRRR